MKTMKSFIKINLIFGFTFFLVSNLFAQPYEGKIVDVLESNITVMVEEEYPLNKGEYSFIKGDEFSLMQMDGTTEMILGDYQVTQITGNTFIAEMIMSEMVPEKEMKVKVLPIARQDTFLDAHQGNESEKEIGQD